MDNSLLLTYTAFLAISVLFSVMLNGLLLKFSKTLGIRNTNDTVIRWSEQSKPSLGGISFYVIFLLTITSYSFIFGNSSAILANNQFLGIVVSCTIAFLMGLADDAYNTRPFLKFFVQVLCAVIVIISGISIHLFRWDWLNYLFTAFWIVGMMNSLNMLDNMDAITASVSITILLTALLVIFLDHRITTNIHVLLLLGVMGSLIGFLYYNWHPSKLFMGDTGSQFLGVFLAGVGILFFWNSSDASGASVHSKEFFISILTFVIPICDTSIVVINRLSRKQSPFIGGKDHTTHHLSYLGFTDRQVSLIFIGLAVLSMGCAVLITSFIPDWGYLQMALFGSYFLAIFGVLFYITKKTKARLYESK